MATKRIGLLHGAILNSGDFLIFNRGKKLLKEYLNPEYELVDVKRWEPSREELDVLIILGGPIISRRLHPQTGIIKEYIEREIPVVCLGLGISGERYPDEGSYFTDESPEFWRKIYQSSHLFSVRDKKTQNILEHYGIPAEFTGCPALYDLSVVRNWRLNCSGYDRGSTGLKPENRTTSDLNPKIAVTIPQVLIEPSPVSIVMGIRNIFLTLFFIYDLKSKVNGDPNFLLILQHGYTAPLKLISRYAFDSDFKVLDTSGRGLDEVEEIRDADFHIGTRLHSHIFFLSRGKSSYLLNVDNRTGAFLENFQGESENYSPPGIRRLTTKFSREIESPEVLDENIKKTSEDIAALFGVMESFLIRLDKFLKTV